ncbi:MAG TPA: DUF72 domain-containing protein [Thermoanaerobaculia bacterium]|nr:DUF72 domain-containing protein [Thermoanaerobaculia bacterium]
MPDVRVGLCGFTVGAAEYARRFSLVEVQQTFYDPPQRLTLERWRLRMPPPFEFTLKAWQLVTHDGALPTYRRMKRPLTRGQLSEAGNFRDSETVRLGWKETLACARILAASTVVFQCPASFRPTDENVANLCRFFREVDRDGRRFAWEPRGAWPDELVHDLCGELDLTHAVDPFRQTPVTTGLAYFRIGRAGERRSYSDQELRRLSDLASRFEIVYAMFNNMPRVGDAERFQAILDSRG